MCCWADYNFAKAASITQHYHDEPRTVNNSLHPCSHVCVSRVRRASVQASALWPLHGALISIPRPCFVTPGQLATSIAVQLLQKQELWSGDSCVFVSLIHYRVCFLVPEDGMAIERFVMSITTAW